jgi:hypothetical protein
LAQVTWDPSRNLGEQLSKDNLTSVGGPLVSGLNHVYGTFGVKPGQKAYVELATSGIVKFTGLALGFANERFDGNTDRFENGVADRVDPLPRRADDVTVHWDGIVEIGGAWLSNVHRAVASMADPGFLGLAIDLVNYRFYWISSLNNRWNEGLAGDPASGNGWNISSLRGRGDLFPYMSTYQVTGATAVINGGSRPFHFTVPEGFTPIDTLARSPARAQAR